METKKIACRICPKCGLYNDVSIGVCECGQALELVQSVLVDRHIPPDKCGEVDFDMEFYVQKCPNCGVPSYTPDPNVRVKLCPGCAKQRIASVKPIRYTEEAPKPKDEEKKPNPATVNFPGGGTAAVRSEQTEEEKEADSKVAFWSGLLGNVAGTVSASKTQEVSKPENEDKPGDEDPVGWDDLVPAKKVPDMVLTAVRYGTASLTVTAREAEEEVTLGRSARLADFLSQDIRVSHYHCAIRYRDGRWIVRDNHSNNGTFVNGRDIGLNGEAELSEGALLKLGHKENSMEFKVHFRS